LARWRGSKQCFGAAAHLVADFAVADDIQIARQSASCFYLTDLVRVHPVIARLASEQRPQFAAARWCCADVASG
jgi:hypothetical protein